MTEEQALWQELLGVLGRDAAHQAARILRGARWVARVTRRPEPPRRDMNRARTLFHSLTEQGWPGCKRLKNGQRSKRAMARMCETDARTLRRWLRRPPPKPKCPVDRIGMPHLNEEVG